MAQLIPNVHWVGAVEWTLQFFHGHELSIKNGTSYNSYLIQDEKIALIDLVKETHKEEWVREIEKLVPLEKIDYLIMNHCEPDHSGAFPVLAAKNPNVKIVVSKNGMTSFNRHFPGKWNVLTAKTGDVISLGKRSLRFFETPMLHWPDSMFAYCPEDKILFPNDAFGQHYGSSFRFADEVDQSILWQEAHKYFANILTLYSKHIIRKVGEFGGLGWPVEMICPSHGLVWRKNPMQIVNKYLEWSAGKSEESVIVLFDTIWGGTEKMAQAICRGLEAENMPYKMFLAGTADFNDVMTDIHASKGLIMGSPTLNNGIMPTLAPYLESIRNLRFNGKIGAAFGTYGWSGECVKRLEEFMMTGGIQIVQMGIRSQFRPNEEDLGHCETFGRGFAKQLRERQ